MILTESQRRAAVLRVLKRLQGSGYADEETGPRHGELYSIADAVTQGGITLDRAIAQAFGHTATEMLADLELAYGTGSRENRETEAERQERLVALVASQGFTEQDIEDAIGDFVPSDPMVGASVDSLVFDDSPDATAVFAAVADMDSADYDDARKRGIVAESLARSMPGRHFGYHAKRGTERIVVKDAAPTWNGAQVIGQTALGEPSLLEFVQSLPKSRLLSYGPATPLRAEDLNAIQRAILSGPANGAVRSQTGTAWGGPRILFAETVAPTTTVDIDASVDWRDRLVFAIVRRSAAADILPGNAGDVDFNDSAYSAVSFFFYSGPGGGLYNDNHGDVLIGASSSTGALQVYNSSGSNTERVVGFVFASPDLGEY